MRRIKLPVLLVMFTDSIDGVASVLTFQSRNKRDQSYRQLIQHGKINIGTQDKPDFRFIAKAAVGNITGEYVFPKLKEQIDGDSTSK